MLIKKVIRDEIEETAEIAMDPSPKRRKRKRGSPKASPKKWSPSSKPD